MPSGTLERKPSQESESVVKSCSKWSPPRLSAIQVDMPPLEDRASSPILADFVRRKSASHINYPNPLATTKTRRWLRKRRKVESIPVLWE